MFVRSTKPEKGNKYFIRKASGGYSTCIKGSPTDPISDVLANCVGFANGAFNEALGLGYEKYPLNCNAENFIERAISLGLKVQLKPVKGGIMVWKKGATLNGSDGAGHVAYVSKDESEMGADKVYTSESGYGSSAFWNTTRSKGNGNWGAGAGYTYRGCIVPPNYVPTPTPSTLKYKVGDEVIFTGKLYGDSFGGKPGQTRKNLKAVISLVNDKGSKPYNINNGLGWVAEEDLKPFEELKPEPTPTPGLKVGDRVRIVALGNANSFGTGVSTARFTIGWERQILDIIPGRTNPIRVGDENGTVGWYKENSLERL